MDTAQIVAGVRDVQCKIALAVSGSKGWLAAAVQYHTCDYYKSWHPRLVHAHYAHL